MVPEKIRVLHVITRLILGGAQENTLLTVTHLDRGRYATTLASGPTEGPEGSLEDRIPANVEFVRVSELVRDPHPVSDVVALGRLTALMRRGRYHIVHTHTTKAGLLGRIAAAAARVPVVVHTPHGHAFHDYLGSAGSRALVWAERALARWTDRMICLTEAEKADHVRFGIGPAEQFEVIHSGVDIEGFAATRISRGEKRKALGLPPAGPLVGCVARLVHVKGVHYLLDAVPVIRAAVPAATVVFVGDGPLRGELERRAAMNGLNGAAVFLGLRRDVAEILPLFDVVVLPSLNEGMGRAAVEAMAAGRPVIGAKVSGIQNVIKDGETGLLVPPADATALAQAVIRCLGDPNSSRAMGKRARQTIDAYGIGPMISKLDDLYIQLLTQTPGGRRVVESLQYLPAAASHTAGERDDTKINPGGEETQCECL
jgi:glycosyltransferase involved in cell wall biosynthesis